ncbi:MAG TPA: ATP-binding protein [Desulfurivibrionaceae bacterium]|jgi:signal transduction histidine kinase
MSSLNPYRIGKKWLPLGYRLKLFLTFLTVLVFCGGGLILLFGQSQRQTLLNNTYNKGRFVSSVLARNLETPLFFMNLEQISASTEAIFGATDIASVLVYDKDGKLIFSRLTHPQAKEAAVRPEEMDRLARLMAEHTTVGDEVPTGHWRQERDFVFCRRIITAGQSSDQNSLYFDTGKVEQPSVTDLGGVQIVFSLTQYQQGMEKIIRHAVLVFLSFLPISLFTALMLARDVVRPLRALVETLRARLGKREEEKEEEEGKATDEITQLDTRLKHLVGQLDQSFATIAQMNEGLEEQVAIRTAELTRAMRELKETQAQMVQTEKMAAVGQLVAGVAHEVNNTTNFITGALPPLGKRLAELRSLLDRQGAQCCPDSGRMAELMQSIDLLMGNVREGARRTSKIVTDLKNFSRPDDDLSLQLDINQCLESTLALALPEYKHRIEVSREFAPDLPLVPGSQGQICQVFMNLIINAVHAQPGKGSLLIRTFGSGDGVHVVFQDKGPGIPKKIQKRIFEPFFTTKEVGKGTGLGLSVSFGIINKHRGRILVRSEPGQGAEFEVILPAGPEAIAAQHEEKSGR